MPSRLPTIADIDSLLAKARQECAPAKVLQRLECIRSFCAGGKSVTLICREYGMARGTFYRILRLADMQNWRTLLDASRCPHSTRSTDLEPKIADLIRGYRRSNATNALAGKQVIKRLLQSEHGISVSVSAIGRLIAKEKLFFGDSLLHQRKRAEQASPTPLLVGSAAMLPVIPDTPIHPQDTQPVSMPIVRRWKASLLGFIGFSLVLILTIGALRQIFGVPSSLIESNPMHAAADERARTASLDIDDLRTPALRVLQEPDSPHQQ